MQVSFKISTEVVKNAPALMDVSFDNVAPEDGPEISRVCNLMRSYLDGEGQVKAHNHYHLQYDQLIRQLTVAGVEKGDREELGRLIQEELKKALKSLSPDSSLLSSGIPASELPRPAHTSTSAQHGHQKSGSEEQYLQSDSRSASLRPNHTAE